MTWMLASDQHSWVSKPGFASRRSAAAADSSLAKVCTSARQIIHILDIRHSIAGSCLRGVPTLASDLSFRFIFDVYV